MHLAYRVAATSSSSYIAACLVIGSGGGWRRFGTCDHGSSSSSSTINFSPKINSSIQSFLAKASSNPLAARAVSDLRSDHAGEWGAVKIYEGVEWAANVRLSYDSDAQSLLRLIDFSRRHRESESSHLLLLSQMLPPQHRTRLLPLWTAAGFLLGAVPLFVGGPTAVYRTVVHVETFVEQHYNEQVDWMSREAVVFGSCDSASPLRSITRVLTACCSDEVNHMHEAAAAASSSTSAVGAAARSLQVFLDNMWRTVVASGSASAVAASRVF